MRCKIKSITLIHQEFLINDDVRNRAVLNCDEWGSNPQAYDSRLI